MTVSLLTVLQFHPGQAVRFIGGTGTIESYRPESGTWMYLIEMELGAEPEFGRVGAETMLWLPQSGLLPLEEAAGKVAVPLHQPIYRRTA